MRNATCSVDIGGVDDTRINAGVNVVHNQTLEREVSDRGVDDRATWVVIEHPVGITNEAAIWIGGVNHTAVGGAREGHARGDVLKLEGEGAVATAVGINATRLNFHIIASFSGDNTNSTGVGRSAEVVRKVTSTTVVAVKVDCVRNQEVVTCVGKD